MVMSNEYCEGCDRVIDLDEDDSGVYITTPAVLYGDNPEPWSITFMCGECYEKALMEHESNEAAQCDDGEARRRGEL